MIHHLALFHKATKALWAELIVFSMAAAVVFSTRQKYNANQLGPYAKSRYQGFTYLVVAFGVFIIVTLSVMLYAAWL